MRDMPSTAPKMSEIKYWFEHDAKLELWTVRVTHKGEEIFISVGASRKAVMTDAIRFFAEMRREAA
jgi:hypothetical protein